MNTKFIIIIMFGILINFHSCYGQILQKFKQKVTEEIDKKLEDFDQRSIEWKGRKEDPKETEGSKVNQKDDRPILKNASETAEPSVPKNSIPNGPEDSLSNTNSIRFYSPNGNFKTILLASYKGKPRFGSIKTGNISDPERTFTFQEYNLLGMERFFTLIEYKYLYDLLEGMDKERFMSSFKEGTAEEFHQYFTQQYIKETMASHLENSLRYRYFCNSKKYDCGMTDGNYSDFDHAKEWGGDSEDVFRIRQTYLNFVKEDYLKDLYTWASAFMQEGEEYYFVSESRLGEYDFNKEAFEFHLSLPHGGGLSDVAPKYSVFRFSNTIFPDDHTNTRCSLPVSIDEVEKIYELYGGRSNTSGKTIPIYVVYKMRLHIKEVNLKVSAQNQKPHLVFDVSMVDDEVDVFFDEKLNNKVGTLNLLDHVN
ncbi:hypothetical protein [Cyclobacterium plantarum]|uniref:Uncharacterized protein n=1 Tax=Cyclobacterium plantarum TaxID=2716263 RepID=A0ABX0H612_9BACT|nr:hypothetical protein [Cyclobacterium plantarum]NHE55759.1 hypothetical protein [Cyclobacterium plantarum]